MAVLHPLSSVGNLRGLCSGKPDVAQESRAAAAPPESQGKKGQPAGIRWKFQREKIKHIPLKEGVLFVHARGLLARAKKQTSCSYAAGLSRLNFQVI